MLHYPDIPFFWDMTLRQMMNGPRRCATLDKHAMLRRNVGIQQRMTQRRIQEEHNPQLHCCENLKTRLNYTLSGGGG